jgi:AcrR family transcriptional regulator
MASSCPKARKGSMASDSKALLRNKAINTAIVFGAEENENRSFSLEAIAEAIQEQAYPLYALFKTKENLLALAGEKVYEALSGKALELAKKEKSLHDFFNAYLDYLLQEPTYTLFTLHYGHGVPHIAPLADDRINHRKKVISDSMNVLKAYGIGPEEDDLLLWSYCLRHLVYFAGYLLQDPHSDTPENRLQSESLITHGLKAFVIQGGEN